MTLKSGRYIVRFLTSCVVSVKIAHEKVHRTVRQDVSDSPPWAIVRSAKTHGWWCDMRTVVLQATDGNECGRGEFRVSADWTGRLRLFQNEVYVTNMKYPLSLISINTWRPVIIGIHLILFLFLDIFYTSTWRGVDMYNVYAMYTT